MSRAPMMLPPLRSLTCAALVLLTLVIVCLAWIDRPYALWQSRHLPELAPIAHAYTAMLAHLGLPGLPKWTHPLMIALVGCALTWRGGYVAMRPVLLTAGVLLATRLSVAALKGLVQRVRPFEHLADPSLGNFFVAGHDSFPSGHTAVYAGLLLPAALLFARWRAPLLAFIAIGALARVGENVHYLGDVLASVLIALLFTLLLGRMLGLRFAAHA